MCGQITLMYQRRTITPFPLLWCLVGDQDKPLASHVCYSTCAVDLRVWINGTIHVLPFTVSEVWRETKEYVFDYNFCLTPVSGHSSTNQTHHWRQVPTPSGASPSFFLPNQFAVLSDSESVAEEKRAPQQPPDRTPRIPPIVIYSLLNNHSSTFHLEAG
jgi:hypothetical protein